ncbi:MAG TPA: tetratricopeptide repeat protein [Stellaceae bacterium]|nr:tetratricopeptide repeat protein [Stellaceae bacterium]
MSEDAAIAALIARARQLAARAEDDAAKAVYIDVLRRDPTHFAALNELATLAYASGHRSAARTAYEQAVRCHPGNPLGRVNLGNLLAEDQDFATARAQYEAALAADPDLAEAHQGLARALSELGETAAAEPHWQKGFSQHALVMRPYRGTGKGVPVLLLVSARGGNIPTQQILDDRVFAVSALYAEFFDPARKLPDHALIVNAIGDADLCSDALARAEAIVKRSTAPVINPPARVRPTGRAANAARLAALPDVKAPTIRVLSKSALAMAELRFPLLLRAPGFHTGRHFVRVERREDLTPAMAQLPGEELLAIDYLDARGADGMARKYRVMIIDGALYPLHLAISADWKVHYFTADMAANAAHREEERRFLTDMPSVIGTRAVAALNAIGKSLSLDYAGVDFGVSADGALLLFEANATMVINPPDPDPVWDYRRAPILAALDAAKRMLLTKAKR